METINEIDVLSVINKMEYRKVMGQNGLPVGRGMENVGKNSLLLI